MASAQTSLSSGEFHCIAGRPRVLCVGDADAGMVGGEGPETLELGAGDRTCCQDFFGVAVV